MLKGKPEKEVELALPEAISPASEGTESRLPELLARAA